MTISDPASGTTIYYTTDGTTPSTSSLRYSGPIALSKSASVIAFATSSGKANSDAAQGNYFLLPAPAISPKGGSFSAAQRVTISLPVPGDLYYTTDGSDPCTNTNPDVYYSYSAITVSSSITLKVVAKIGSGCGAISTAAFVIPDAPIAVTGKVTRLEATTVTLNGSVNPGDLTSKYWFTYGTNCDTPASKTTVKSLAAAKIVENISANLTGLAANTPYCFQLFATNSKGTRSGLTVQFTTQER